MFTRRRFLQIAALAAPAFATRLPAETRLLPLGAQLYTVRAMAAKDLPGTLRRIHDIGYREVELTSVAYKYSPNELRKIVSASGLSAPSAHFGYEKFSSRFPYAHTLGLQWMVCPMIPRSLWSEDGFHRAADQLNHWGRRARSRGMRLGYHNHDYEFQRYRSATGYEILVRNTDPDVVFFELDCYWAAQAGHDPVSMMKHLGSRIRLLHLKDRKPGFPTSTELGESSDHFTEVGRGTLDWPAILAEARKIGVEHYFVEQDKTSGPPMESLRISYDYLRGVLAKMGE